MPCAIANDGAMQKAGSTGKVTGLVTETALSLVTKTAINKNCD